MPYELKGRNVLVTGGSAYVDFVYIIFLHFSKLVLLFMFYPSPSCVLTM